MSSGPKNVVRAQKNLGPEVYHKMKSSSIGTVSVFQSRMEKFGTHHLPQNTLAEESFRPIRALYFILRLVSLASFVYRTDCELKDK